MYIYIYRITVCLIFHFELYYFLVGFSFSLLEVWVYVVSASLCCYSHIFCTLIVVEILVYLF